MNSYSDHAIVNIGRATADMYDWTFYITLHALPVLPSKTTRELKYRASIINLHNLRKRSYSATRSLEFGGTIVRRLRYGPSPIPPAFPAYYRLLRVHWVPRPRGSSSGCWIGPQA